MSVPSFPSSTSTVHPAPILLGQDIADSVTVHFPRLFDQVRKRFHQCALCLQQSPYRCAAPACPGLRCDRGTRCVGMQIVKEPKGLGVAELAKSSDCCAPCHPSTSAHCAYAQLFQILKISASDRFSPLPLCRPTLASPGSQYSCCATASQKSFENRRKPLRTEGMR